MILKVVSLTFVFGLLALLGTEASPTGKQLSRLPQKGRAIFAKKFMSATAPKVVEYVPKDLSALEAEITQENYRSAQPAATYSPLMNSLALDDESNIAIESKQLLDHVLELKDNAILERIDYVLNDQAPRTPDVILDSADNLWFNQRSKIQSPLPYASLATLGTAVSVAAFASHAVEQHTRARKSQSYLVKDGNAGDWSLRIEPQGFISIFGINAEAHGKDAFQSSLRRAITVAKQNILSLKAISAKSTHIRYHSFASDNLLSEDVLAFLPEYTFWTIQDGSNVQVYYAFTSDLARRSRDSGLRQSSSLPPLRVRQLSSVNGLDTKIFSFNANDSVMRLYVAFYMIDASNRHHLDFQFNRRKNLVQGHE